ncbi:TPA: class I SAM-dependent methyltransferase [Streptococcus pyogenes]|nr:class I SAM-dependent methyltransferase [Streptococcus pyogenes]HEQ1314540.1 class I SAM-dependent methyltransferase [Streptococcus pyogenes]HEQ1315732.1 class I SAM-dependent methyltransferase [Streptococcus pyogenes]HER7825381.1 class I SAM-dependent methyltransferase [Streptococcus pyogenes]
MELKPNIYYKTILQYREAELLFEALKLDIFSYLDEPTTLEEFLKSTNYDKENTKYFLSALLSCGYIEKNNLTYCNTKCSKLYLSKNSSKYIGKAILFREKLGSISNIGDKVKDNSLGQNDKLDFSELAEIVHDEMYVTGRVDDFNSEIKQLFSDKYRNYKVLDLGGGSGVLSIEFIRNFPNSTAYVFETSEVACISKKIIEKNDMQDKIFVLEGDFNVDAIGDGYDLIIASGIFNFVNMDITEFICKLSDALVLNGYLLIIGSFFENEEYHKEHILNWLKGYINGMKPAPKKSEIEQSMQKANLSLEKRIKVGLFAGELRRKDGEI